MHSYSQMFLSAYGYTTDLPPEYPEMVKFKLWSIYFQFKKHVVIMNYLSRQFRAMEIAVGALTATYGTKYTYGNTAVTICEEFEYFSWIVFRLIRRN